ncbi:hypothetical protein BDA99DRAFT_534818 [Phascolomyces articulosus]|uniref:Uncharacterized protein n=1 Tax=Phascolomyces articulosus TaxID=60185 RepID=A0AAD5PIE3_9FUNG|nr:hypothetical protein BDA99DRAFT_534818 [Phascolomyces articulosus]
MKDIVYLVYIITKLFDFDTTLLISPECEEDWRAEVARKFSKDSILRDQDVEENVNSMQEDKDEDGDGDGDQTSSVGYVRPSQKRRASVSNYFKREMHEYHNYVYMCRPETDWTWFTWKKLKRTIAGCKDDESDVIKAIMLVKPLVWRLSALITGWTMQ